MIPLDYIEHVLDATRDRKLMARIGLNILHSRTRFPVDVGELNRLSPLNRAAVTSFLLGFALEIPKRPRRTLKELRELVHVATTKSRRPQFVPNKSLLWP